MQRYGLLVLLLLLVLLRPDVDTAQTEQGKDECALNDA